MTAVWMQSSFSSSWVQPPYTCMVLVQLPTCQTCLTCVVSSAGLTVSPNQSNLFDLSTLLNMPHHHPPTDTYSVVAFCGAWALVPILFSPQHHLDISHKDQLLYTLLLQLKFLVKKLTIIIQLFSPTILFVQFRPPISCKGRVLSGGTAEICPRDYKSVPPTWRVTSLHHA